MGETFLTNSAMHMCMWGWGGVGASLIDQRMFKLQSLLRGKPSAESERQATAHTEPLSKYQGNHSR